MSASAAAVNSTNVRNHVNLAWQRLNLAVSVVLAPDKAVERAVRLFTTPPRRGEVSAFFAPAPFA
jgi:hypothetical protein